jgi:hypothetical protein
VPNQQQTKFSFFFDLAKATQDAREIEDAIYYLSRVLNDAETRYELHIYIARTPFLHPFLIEGHILATDPLICRCFVGWLKIFLRA